MDYTRETSLGEHIARYVEWLTQHGADVFDAISLILSGVITVFTSGLLWFSPLGLIAVFALLAYYIQHKVSLTLFVALAFLLILNLGYWQESMETLAQVTFATLICVIVGVPLGIVAAHRPLFYTALRPVLDLMQTVPTFVYLIPTLTLFGLGVVPGLISTVVFAIAAPIRLTYLGICDVPEELMDAGKAFGCSPPAVVAHRAPSCHAQHHHGHHPVHHAVAVDGSHRGSGGRRRPGQTGGQRAEYRGYRHGV